jgi:hypothetical protein
MNARTRILGSALVARAGFGVAPKRTLPLREDVASCEPQRKVVDREHALASTRDACALQKTL